MLKMPIKKPPTFSVRGLRLPSVISTDRRCFKSDRSGLSSGKIEGEVVSVTLVHDFHTKVCAVENVGPGVQYTTLRVDN